MDLLIDIGNTLAKAAVVDGSTFVAEFSAEKLSDLPLESLALDFNLSRSILCTTRGEAEQYSQYVRDRVGHCLLLDASTPVPLRVEYDRSRLGSDRLAAAVGAAALYGGNDLLVVDFGTAITIDFISREGVFEGGFISPGVNTRLRSLHDYTATLPLCLASESVDGVAKTTREAISSGVINGITYEIEGYINAKRAEIQDFFVIFTGGDLNYFDKRIKNTIFAGRDILFKGLVTILDYNA